MFLEAPYLLGFEVFYEVSFHLLFRKALVDKFPHAQCINYLVCLLEI